MLNGIKISELEKSIDKYPVLKQGCIVDTNVLFAGSYPLDIHNNWADEVFILLKRARIPVYTNLNVRSEFLDLQRKVLIPEGLVGFYEDFSESLGGKVYDELKYLKRKAKTAIDNEQAFKLNEAEIKKFMELFGHEPAVEGPSAWTGFCKSYFSPYVAPVWQNAVNHFNINFLGAREIESKKFFLRHPSWENVITIMGESGIGSADAMILNLFKESCFSLLVTADKAVKNTMLNSSFHGKFVLSP